MSHSPSIATPDAVPGSPGRRGRGGRRFRSEAWRPRFLALVAGAGLGAAFVPIGWWPLAIVAVAALTLLVHDRTPRAAAGLGWCFGLGLGAVSITWVGMLGWWVAPILVAVMALWWVLLAWLLQRTQHLPGGWLVAASAWTGVEFATAHLPFGGFPWLRLVWTTIDEPLSGWLPVVGAVGTSWLVALLGQALARVLRPVPHPRNSPKTTGRRVLAPQALALLLAGVLAVVAFGGGELLKRRPVPTPPGPGLNVGIVQGDVSGTAGSHAIGYARSVTVNHVSETIELMARARTGLDPMPDVVLWPENSTDVDPTTDFQTHQLVMVATALADRPLLIGAVMSVPHTDARMTASLWWTREGTVLARYDKRNLVPFGEYIPLRRFVLPVMPVLKQVGQQSLPGHGAGVLSGSLDDGRRVRIGPIICFELAWDATVADTVTHGAQVVVVQSNNSDYTGTGQPRQQFQITRGRAMELRREIVVSTTNSFSGLIDARGHVVLKSAEAGPFARTVTVPLRNGVSLGVRLDPWLDLAATGVTLLGLVAGVVPSALQGRRHARRRGRLGD